MNVSSTTDKFSTTANKNKNVNFHLIELIGGVQVVWCGEKFTQRRMGAGIYLQLSQTIHCVYATDLQLSLHAYTH